MLKKLNAIVASRVGRKLMTKEQVTNLFVDNPEIGLHRRWADAAFGLSKMTVPNENDDGPDEYDQIRFVEFLEMIGRAADFKYQGTP